MSSSTSSSSTTALEASPARNEWKVLLALIVAFLVAELGIRVLERRLSVDIAHIRDAPLVADQIAKPDGAYNVLVIGNSSARAGIEPEVLKQQLEAAGHRDARISFFYPDGGNIGDWRWAWRRYFAPPLKQPDLVMVCGSRSHFDDGEIQAIKAANYFVAASDSAAFLKTELHSLESRLEFIATKLSVSYANRMRTQRRFLDLIMPYNRKVLGEIAENAERKATVEGKARRGDSSTRLAALLDDLRAAHTPTAVVVLPASVPYEVPDSRIDIVKNAGAQWIDLRSVSGIQRSDFYDGAHVNHEGAVKLTTALAAALAQPKP